MSSTHNDFLETNSIYYNSCTQKPSSTINEAQRAAKIIADYGDTVLCLSGGIDSEIMARIFLSCGIKFKVAILRFLDDLNINDITYAINFCQVYNLKYEFVDLNVVDFYNSNQLKFYSEKYSCTSPQFVSYLWFLDQLKGYFPCMADIIPIIGSGKNSIERIKNIETQHGFGVYYIDQMEKPLKPLDIDNISDVVYSLPNEAKLSLVRYFKVNDLNGAPLFFKYTPELIYSMLVHPAMKKFIEKKNSWGYENKLDLYSAFFDFPAIGRYKEKNYPVVGFDLVKKYYAQFGEKDEYDKRYRFPLVQKNPQNMYRYYVDYKKLVEHLYA